MSKVALITLYEVDYIGTRVLTHYLEKHGHQAHIVHFKKSSPVNFYSEKEHHSGYQAIVKRGYVTRNRLDVNPITETEYSLLTQALTELKPDIIGISARSLHNTLMPRLIQACRTYKPDCFLVAGGFGPSLDVDYYLTTGFNAVIRGEGEEALYELTEAIEKNTDWKSIQNVSYLEHGQLIENSMRPQIKNLDEYEAPLYGDEYCSFIENNTWYKNHDEQLKSQIYVTLLGRGCVGKCTYCCGGQWYDQYRKDNRIVYKRRNRSLDNIFQELHQVTKMNSKYIGFTDELFSAPTDELKEFFTRYKKEIGLPFFMYLNYTQLLKHPDVFELALDAGWQSTGIGLQSGSEKLTHQLYARHNKNEEYIAYAKILFDNNIITLIHVLGGNCYETEEDFDQTLAVIKQLPFDIFCPAKTGIQVFRLMPHPKTRILELAPRVLTDPMPAKEWLYRGALCHIRRITTDKEFSEIRRNAFFKENPDLLLALYKNILTKQQYAKMQNLAAELQGKSIIFYGAGDLYQRNKHFFKNCKPIAMLLDDDYIYIYNDTHEIDGIPVYPVSKVHEFDSTCPIIVFAGLAPMLQRKLERQHKIDRQRIHAISEVITEW